MQDKGGKKVQREDEQMKMERKTTHAIKNKIKRSAKNDGKMYEQRKTRHTNRSEI